MCHIIDEARTTTTTTATKQAKTEKHSNSVTIPVEEDVWGRIVLGNDLLPPKNLLITSNDKKASKFCRKTVLS